MALTPLQDVLVQYITLLNNPEGPAPSAPTLTRKQIIEHDTARKEAHAAAVAAAAAAADGGGDSGGDSGGDGGGDGDGDADCDDAASGHGDKNETAQPAAAKAAGGAARGKAQAPPGPAGEGASGLVEPFVGRLFPEHNCHGGACNKPLLSLES